MEADTNHFSLVRYCERRVLFSMGALAAREPHLKLVCSTQADFQNLPDLAPVLIFKTARNIFHVVFDEDSAVVMGQWGKEPGCDYSQTLEIKDKPLRVSAVIGVLTDLIERDFRTSEDEFTPG